MLSGLATTKTSVAQAASNQTAESHAARLGNGSGLDGEGEEATGRGGSTVVAVDGLGAEVKVLAALGQRVLGGTVVGHGEEAGFVADDQIERADKNLLAAVFGSLDDRARSGSREYRR